MKISSLYNSVDSTHNPRSPVCWYLLLSNIIRIGQSLMAEQLKKIAPNGRCGHLSDRGDLRAPPLHFKNPAYTDCADRWLGIVKFQIKWIKTVGCQSIRKFRKARLNSAPSRTREIWLRAIVRTDAYYHLAKFHFNRIRTVSCGAIGKSQEARPTAAPSEKKSKNSAVQDCADWYLVSSHQVPAESDEHCGPWIDLKISRGAPPQRPMEGNRKIRLRAIEHTHV